MKLKRLFLCFMLAIFAFSFVSCDKKTDATPQTPTVNPVLTTSGPYYVGAKLEAIKIRLSSGDTPGVVAWKNKNYELRIGDNICEWAFTPDDTTSYSSKTGSITITAQREKSTPTVTNVHIENSLTPYNEAKYSTIPLVCEAEFDDIVVEGLVTWKYPDRTFVLGNNSCEWKFTPNDVEIYNVVFGTINITVTEEQYIESIAVKSNTKTSGFEAFDEYDLSGLTLDVIYNAGKHESRTLADGGISVTYLSGTNLKAGDTKVVASFAGKSCDVAIAAVSKKAIAKPTFADVVYSGDEKEIKVAQSEYYTFTPLYKTNVGNYDLELTLNDAANCKWVNENDNVSTINVVCKIVKAEAAVVETNYSGEYDSAAHGASVTSANATSVYYSTSALTAENYLTNGVASPISTFVNAGNYTVYYYLVGDENHKDKTGTLQVSISKQVPNVICEYCYTVETGSAVNYPADFVTIKDKQGNTISKGTLSFVYYSTYVDDQIEANDIKTNLADDGALGDGLAPANQRSAVYYVVVGYAGDNGNFAAASGVANIYIDKEDNGFYALTGSEFAFKDDGYTAKDSSYPDQYYVSASNQECCCYLQFEALAIDSYGLKRIKYISKFGSGASAKKGGYLIFKDNKYQLVENETGTVYELDINENTFDISLEINETEKTLSKWTIPEYLDTYLAQTVSDVDYGNGEHNDSKYSSIRIFNDYGTIRFEMIYETTYIENAIVTNGHGVWYGIVETKITKNVSLNFVFNCYLIGSGDDVEDFENNVGYSTTDELMILSCQYTLDKNPTTLTLASSYTSKISNSSSMPSYALRTDYSVATN